MRAVAAVLPATLDTGVANSGVFDRAADVAVATPLLPNLSLPRTGAGAGSITCGSAAARATSVAFSCRSSGGEVGDSGRDAHRARAVCDV